MERMLERIINRAIDINQHFIAELASEEISPPKDYTQTFLILAELKIYSAKFAKEIVKSIGTRNKLVHDYEKIDKKVLYNSVKDCLADYDKYCEYILKFLSKVK